MSVDANPDVARKVRENELNKQIGQSNRLKEIQGVYDQAQGEGSVAQIQQAVDIAKEKPLSSTESMENSFGNMVNRIKGSIPRLKIVSADIYDNVFGKELAKKIYEFEGRDINQIRNEAYSELETLAQQVKPTLGLTESIQNNDWKGLAAGTVNAITSLGSTAVPAIATMGAGLFTEMTGDAIVDFNETKAKRLGKTVEQLYKDDEADFGIPATIGALSGALELYGMKGVKNLITDKIKGQGYKKALLFFGETQKEGLTELVQTGLEETNRALADGKSASEATKQGIDKMFSKQGLESYLQGIVGAGAAGGVGQVVKMVNSPKLKNDLNTELQSVNLMEMELQRPEISEASRATIENQLNQSVSNMANIIEEDQQVEDKLSPAQKKEAERIGSQISEIDAVIEDPNVSKEVKSELEAKRKPLEQELEQVYETPVETTGTPVKKGTDVAIDDTIELVNGKKGKVTKVEGDQVTMTMENGATFMATPELVEMSVIKPLEAPQETKTPEVAQEPTEVKEVATEPVIEETKPIIDEVQTPTEEVVTEDISEKRTKEVLDKANTDLEALKQVQNKPAKYKASVKRLTDAFKAGEITEQEFNDTKARFDDVIAESSPNVPKKETLTTEEITNLDNELANQDLKTDDFIQYERARAIENANNDAEAVQQPENDGAGVTGEVKPSETAQEPQSNSTEKVTDLQARKQAIKDRISQKIKASRSNLSSGIDPSLLSDFVELGATYIEEGIVKASDFIKRFREDAKELGVDDSQISDEDITNEVYNAVQPEQEQKKASDSFTKLAHTNIESEEIRNTLNNVERETGRQLTEEEKEYRATKLNDALVYGTNLVEQAKEEFGKTYVGDLINYLNENANTLSLENRSLGMIALELDLERQLQEDPDNVTLNKQLKLVRDASTKFQRAAAKTVGYGRLRQIARVGYDISLVTDQFFSEQQLEDKRKLNKAIEATPDEINKEAEEQEQNITEDFNINPKPRKPKFGLTEAQQKEKAELAKQFRGVFNDVTRIATLLADKKFMRYAKLVLLDTAGDFESFAKSMIDSVGNGIKEHLPRIYKEVGGTDEVTNKTENQKEKAKSAKEIVKKALIDKGYGREITVNTKDAEGNKVKEKRSVLDWKKLAGEEGSVENIKSNVESALTEQGYSEGDISAIQNDLTAEYNRLHASIIEKSLNELQSRNQEREPIDVKTSARRLAELYNYGLFEQESDTYDNIVNRALGLSKVGQKAFDEAKVLAQALSDLYRSTDANGRKISEFGLKEAIRNINGEIERLLTDVAWEQSNMAFKVATVAKEFMGLSQRAMLQTVKQIIENPLSGFVQRAFTRLGYGFEGTDTKSLRNKRSEAARIIYEDIVRNGGLNYGEIITPFVTRGAFEKKLDRLSDSKIYHTALSGLLGRAFLDGADSMHKSALTERYFVHNLVRVLMKKGMSKQEAIEYVSNSLTGQKFTDALGSAKQIIDKANEDAGKKIIPDNPQAIYRLAQNIVRDALVVGENITLREVEASYKSAYKAAGYDLGHEANNIVSETVSNATTKLENAIKQAVKDKKWNHATALTFTSILTKNVLNPFVSGGTNWIVLSLQKAGVDIISPVVDYARQKENKLDLTTKDGVKNMENALLSEMRYKNTMNRVVIGAMASLLVATAAIASGEDEDLAKWLKKNDWAKKYFKAIAPQALILLIAQENKQVADYLIGLFGFTYDSFSDTKKLTQAFQGLTADGKSKQAKGERKLGEVLGGHTSFPGPWRVARDVENIYRGIEGKKPVKPDYKKGGFWDGYLRNGVVEYFTLER